MCKLPFVLVQSPSVVIFPCHLLFLSKLVLNQRNCQLYRWLYLHSCHCSCGCVDTSYLLFMTHSKKVRWPCPVKPSSSINMSSTWAYFRMLMTFPRYPRSSRPLWGILAAKKNSRIIPWAARTRKHSCKQHFWLRCSWPVLPVRCRKPRATEFRWGLIHLGFYYLLC